MSSRRQLLFLLAASCIWLAGCATSRSEIRIESPTADASAAPASGKLVAIRSISDARVFEEKPKEPSTPSLGFGGAGAAPDDVKARAIGRKRNAYGKALGDVLLEPGQTVEGLVRENLSVALAQAGYRVVEPGTAGALALDVRIERFWSWFQPGFWAIKLHAQIATEVRAEGGAAFTVEVKAEDSRQMAPESAWMEIIGLALEQYRAAATEKARGAL